MAYRVAQSLAPRPGIGKSRPQNPYAGNSLAQNPYGSKTGPRGKFGPADLAQAALGVFGAPGSLPQQFLSNFIGAGESEADWDRFEQDVDANNRVLEQNLQQLGYGETGNAQDQARALQVNMNQRADAALNNTAISNRFNQAFGGVNESLSALPGSVNQQASDALGTYGTASGTALDAYGNTTRNTLQAFDRGAGDINAGYQERLGTARGLVGQQSDQDRLDINRQYNQERATQQQNLVSQGLTGSTVGASVGGGIERQRRDALQRQSDQRLNQLLGVEQGFGGEALTAQTGLLGAGANLRSGMGGTALQGGLNAAGTGLQGGLNAAGIQSNVGLGAYGLQGGYAGQRFGEGNAAEMERLRLRGQYGQYPIDVGLDVSRMGNDVYGPQRTLLAPRGFNPGMYQ